MSCEPQFCLTLRKHAWGNLQAGAQTEGKSNNSTIVPAQLQATVQPNNSNTTVHVSLCFNACCLPIMVNNGVVLLTMRSLALVCGIG